MQETVTFNVTQKELGYAFEVLESKGFTQMPSGNIYESFRFVRDDEKGKITIVGYNSGKIVIQGKDLSKFNLFGSTDTSDKSKKSASTDLTDDDYTGIARIGADEVGKGDYFGPLVTVSAFLNMDLEGKLEKTGIMDSKKLTDEVIVKIYDEVKEVVPFAVNIIEPSEYNQSYLTDKNVAILLGRSHAHTMDALVSELSSRNIIPDLILLDQFSSKDDRVVSFMSEQVKQVPFIQFPKGERDMAIAVASIIARANFLIEWEKMEKKYNFRFPKGATNVIKAGKDFVKQIGEKELINVAKISFRTTGQVLAK